MVHIQIDIDEKLDTKIEVFNAKKRLKDKRKAVVEMLKDYKDDDEQKDMLSKYHDEFIKNHPESKEILRDCLKTFLEDFKEWRNKQ